MMILHMLEKQRMRLKKLSRTSLHLLQSVCERKRPPECGRKEGQANVELYGKDIAE